MAFSNFELTNTGINLLGQVSTGQPLIFTKIQLGDGNFAGTVKALTSLFSSFKDADITDIVIQEDNSVNIKSEFNNDGFLTSKEWKEIGIFAKVGETGTEVLYSYSYSLLAVETIPAETIPYRRDLNFRNYISDVTNVTYDITIQKDKYDFDSDVAMQSASYLVEGDRVNVWKDDSCQKRRVAITDNNGILLNNGLYANLILDIQGKYSSSITLTDKTVVGAINELNETKASAKMVYDLETKLTDKIFVRKHNTDGGTVEVEGEFNGSSETESDGLNRYSVILSLDENRNGWVSGMISINLDKFSEKMPVSSDDSYKFCVNMEDIFDILPSNFATTFGTGHVYDAKSGKYDLIGSPMETTWQSDNKILFYIKDHAYANTDGFITGDLNEIRISFFLPLFSQTIE